MGLFDLFRAKTQYKDLLEQQRLDFMQQRHEQKLEYEKRKQELDIKIKTKEAELKQKEIDLAILEIEDEMNPPSEDGESENIDSMLGQFAMNLLNKKQSENGLAAVTPDVVTNHPTQNLSSSGVSFSDQELMSLISAQPKYLINIAKTLDDDKIKEFVRSKFPKIDEDSLNRGIKLIKK